MRRLLPALLVMLGASCMSGPAPDVEVDMGSLCSRVALEVRDPAVLPGWQVHALAVEREEGERAWALATDGEGRLQLVAWPDGEAYDFSAVAEVGELQLVPGATGGQTWVLLDREGETQVWRVDEEGLTSGPRLVDFPAAGSWTRRLVFLDGAAWVLSVPTSGDSSTIELVASYLDDTLTPAGTQSLPLWRICADVESPAQCRPPSLSGEVTVELLGTTDGGSLGGAAALIAMYASATTEPVDSSRHATLVMAVELGSLGTAMGPLIVRHDLPYWPATPAVRVAPAFIVADSQALYWLVGLQPLVEGETGSLQDLVYRVRREDLGAQVMAAAPKEQRSHLLQVGGQVAFGQITDTTWKIAPIDGNGVAVDLTGSLALDPGSVVSLAGRGQFLVRSDVGARRVAVVCGSE